MKAEQRNCLTKFAEQRSAVKCIKNSEREQNQNLWFHKSRYSWTDNLEDLLAKSRDLVDYYIVEFLNLNAAGSAFTQLLKENFPESYAIVNDRKKLYLLWKIRVKF